MKVILEGNEKDVSNIIRENRLRTSRGLVSFYDPDSENTESGNISKRGRKKKEPVIDGKASIETDNKELE